MEQVVTAPPALKRSRGRGYLWLGIGLFLLSFVLMGVPIAVGHLAVPWYAPIVATAGVGLIVLAMWRRPTVVRAGVLVLCGLLCLAQWFLLGVVMRLPAYAGPAQGQPLPAFTAARADGTPFTEKDLAKGQSSVLVFFRGRW